MKSAQMRLLHAGPCQGDRPMIALAEKTICRATSPALSFPAVETSRMASWQPGHVVTLSTELEHPSPIHFGHAIDGQFIKYLSRYSFDRLFFCAEEPIFRLHGQRLYDEAQRHFPCQVQFLPAGERCKSFSVLEELC